MAESIDSLQIEINAKASRANDAIDRLVGKIDRLTTSMNRLDGSKLASLANGVQRLGTAMQTMNNVKTADFTRLSRNLQNLNNVDVSKLSNLSVNVKRVATAFNGLSGMEKSAEQISLLANGIKQLGYSSADKAITNIPRLATAMKKLMAELSTAPRVSQNLIDMTNALAKLARTGSASGKAANSLVNSFNRISKASQGAKINLLSTANGISAIRSSILQAMGVAGGFYAVFQGIKESINIASDLTEVQNVVDVAFGKYKKSIEDFSKVSISDYGMSELTAKTMAGRFQAMGIAVGFSQKKMSGMSVELTKLAGDMASFYNVEQDAVAKSLQSVFTGETEPLRKYGLDITQATLKEWALKNGIDANINSMSQMEKTMLRYQYVMANTGAAQGDFIRTQDTWANQIRILKENFKALGAVIGSSFINALKPLVKALNVAMGHIIAFAKVVSDSLGKIFGWKYEDTSGGIANDYDDAADSAGDLADNTGKAANNAKKLKQQLQGIDELNVLTTNTTGDTNSTNTSGVPAASEDASGGNWTKTDSMLKEFESDLDTLYKLGSYISEKLTEALNSIDWNEVYKAAEGFGSGLASFLNGLITPELFSALGRTIAGAINTALHALDSFGQTFNWSNFGNSVASGINSALGSIDWSTALSAAKNFGSGIGTAISTFLQQTDWSLVGSTVANAINTAIQFALSLGSSLDFSALGESISGSINGFFETFDFGNLAKTLNVWVDGIKTAITSALKGISLADILKAGSDFLNELEIDTLSIAIGAFAWTHGGQELTASIIKDVLKNKLGIGTEISLGSITAKIGIAIAVALESYKVGNWLYENVSAVQKFSDGVSAWIFKDGEEIAIARTISVALTGLAIALPVATIVGQIATAIGGAVAGGISMTGIKLALTNVTLSFLNGASCVWTGLSTIASGLVSALGTAISGLATVASTIVSSIGTALSSAGTFLSSSVSSVFAGGAASIAGGLFAAIGAAIAGWNIGQLIYNKFSEQIDSVVEKVGDFFTKTIPQALSNAGSAIVDFSLNVKGNIDEKAQKIKDWFSDKKENIKEFVAKVKSSGKEKLDDLKESWKKITSGLKNINLKATAKAAGKSAIDGIKKSWDKLMKSKKVQELKVAFQDNFTTPLKNAWNKLASVINKGIEGMNKVLPKNLEISARVPTFATGGFPEDGWFRASRGEMLGKFDNGQSVVANNNQITEGISAAVYKGNQENNQLLREEITVLRVQNQLLTELLNKEVGISYSDVGKASQKYAREYTNRTGRPAYI